MSTPALQPLVVPALNDSYGALLIGTFVGLILFGIIIHQAYRYYRVYWDDSGWLKALVVLVLVLETFTSILGMHACYYHLVSNYFKPQTLMHLGWSVKLHPTATVLAMVVAQSFFMRRVWMIGRRFRPLVVLAAMCSLSSLGVSITSTITVYNSDDSKTEAILARLCAICSVLALVADWILALALIYALSRSRTGFKRTDSMIDLMIVYSVTTGLLTGILDVLICILAFTFPGRMAFVAACIPGGKMYANNLLAALNSRKLFALHGSSGAAAASQEGSAPGYQVKRSVNVQEEGAVLELKVSSATEFTVGSGNASSGDVEN